MKARPNNLRKAAVLLASLDSDSADMLLAQMSPDQARAARAAMNSLGKLDADEQTDVIEEFFRIGPLVPERAPVGVEFAGSLARRFADSHEAAPVPKPHYQRDASPAFRALHEADPAELARLLEREHPQTVAVVVSRLRPNQAADVLASLSAGLQAQVARRLVDLDEADPEILAEVERSLEGWLSQRVHSDRRRQAGLAALGSILESTDRHTHRSILNNLARHDSELAGQLDSPTSGEMISPVRLPHSPFSFADVAELDDRSLGIVLRAAEPELIVLALAGATAELAARCVYVLGPHDGGAIRQQLNRMGPTRISDVEQAQYRLAQLATELCDAGQIRRNKRGLSLAV